MFSLVLKMLFAAFAIALLCVPVSALSAEAYVLYDVESQTAVCARSETKRAAPASTTKLMTALCVIGSGTGLDQTVEISREAASAEGSRIYLEPGQRVSVRTLLYGLLLSSGNDAAIALAEGVDGSVQDFCGRMNRMAAELGMENTCFQNPHGLPAAGHYSSALDLARLMACISREPELMRMVGTREYAAEGFCFQNHNKLLWRIPQCDGGKTGYTSEAGRCLVSTAVFDGRRYVAVTLSAPEDWKDHESLYGQVPQMRSLYLSARDMAASIPLAGTEGRLYCCPDGGVRLSVPGHLISRVQVRLCLPRFAYGEVAFGQMVGYASVCAEGEELARVPLFAVRRERPQHGLLRRLLARMLGVAL